MPKAKAKKTRRPKKLFEVSFARGSVWKTFHGQIFSVGLTPRLSNPPPNARTDLHVLIQIGLHCNKLGKPWDKYKGESMSSYWLQDLTLLLMEAHTWMSEHCERDGQYGYKFKEALVEEYCS